MPELEVENLDEAILLATQQHVAVLSRWNGRRVRVSAAGRVVVVATEVQR